VEEAKIKERPGGGAAALEQQKMAEGKGDRPLLADGAGPIESFQGLMARALEPVFALQVAFSLASQKHNCIRKAFQGWRGIRGLAS